MQNIVLIEEEIHRRQIRRSARKEMLRREAQTNIPQETPTKNTKPLEAAAGVLAGEKCSNPAEDIEERWSEWRQLMRKLQTATESLVEAIPRATESMRQN